MKKIFTVLVLLCATLVASAQEVPSSFPRKFLLEHFTGEDCGYCPGGMYAIVNHIDEATTPYIWVSHHYGYGTDEYSIAASKKIGGICGVAGAPNMGLNRTKLMGSAIAFHPGYLPDLADTISKLDTVAEASVVIEHTYDSVSRQLNITVSGQVANTEVEEYLLTVLIKENRLVGGQADYQYSWKTKGWKEYMHARVVRDVLTNAEGDLVTVSNQAYSKSFTYTLDEKWVPENCCVVAYITPSSKKPVINAEQTPLVAGTTGGEQYNPYGITSANSPNKTVKFETLQQNKLEDNILELVLISNSSIRDEVYGPLKPVCLVYVNTEADTLVAGTYPIKDDNSLGSVMAGYSNDETTSFGGSLMVYALAAYLKQGQIAAAHMWYLKSGEMIVDEAGNIILDFKTNGDFGVNTTYGEPQVGVENVETENAVANKLLLDGKIIILNEGKVYDVLGNQVR